MRDDTRPARANGTRRRAWRRERRNIRKEADAVRDGPAARTDRSGPRRGLGHVGMMVRPGTRGIERPASPGWARRSGPSVASASRHRPRPGGRGGVFVRVAADDPQDRRVVRIVHVTHRQGVDVRRGSIRPAAVGENRRWCARADPFGVDVARGTIEGVVCRAIDGRRVGLASESGRHVLARAVALGRRSALVHRCLPLSIETAVRMRMRCRVRMSVCMSVRTSVGMGVRSRAKVPMRAGVRVLPRLRIGRRVRIRVHSIASRPECPLDPVLPAGLPSGRLRSRSVVRIGTIAVGAAGLAEPVVLDPPLADSAGTVARFDRHRCADGTRRCHVDVHGPRDPRGEPSQPVQRQQRQHQPGRDRARRRPA